MDTPRTGTVHMRERGGLVKRAGGLQLEYGVLGVDLEGGLRPVLVFFPLTFAGSSDGAMTC